MRRDGVFGYIDTSGALIAPLQKIVDFRPFSEVGGKLWLPGEKVGIMNKKGTVFFPRNPAVSMALQESPMFKPSPRSVPGMKL